MVVLQQLHIIIMAQGKAMRLVILMQPEGKTVTTQYGQVQRNWQLLLQTQCAPSVHGVILRAQYHKAINELVAPVGGQTVAIIIHTTIIIITSIVPQVQAMQIIPITAIIPARIVIMRPWLHFQIVIQVWHHHVNHRPALACVHKGASFQ